MDEKNLNFQFRSHRDDYAYAFFRFVMSVLVDKYLCFRGIICFHLQGRNNLVFMARYLFSETAAVVDDADWK